MKITKIYNNDDTLAFQGNNLATRQEYEQADRCEGSIFESLQEGEIILLVEGSFMCDSDLDII